MIENILNSSSNMRHDPLSVNIYLLLQYIIDIILFRDNIGVLPSFKHFH